MATKFKRKLNIKDLNLLKGSHSPDSKFCVMEAVAFVAGEPWSDHPECACPVISVFMRRWNDDLNDVDRQMLKPYISKLVGTRSTKEVEQKRGWMITDWMIRVYLPAWLELGGMKEHASVIRGFESLVSVEQLENMQPKLDAARAAARGAARGAAWDAARDAAWGAARAAAWAAAWAAARGAARDAARDAARAAAWDAAWDAARAAAVKKLQPTVVLSLQKSALKLLDDLIACKEDK